MDITKTPVTLGALLTMAPAIEQIKANRQANRSLTRDYRKPFVVPKKV